MRLFIAINIPDPVKDSIEESARMAAEIVPGNYSRRENYHLTLAFLGEVDGKDAGRIEGILGGLDYRASKITIGDYGSFNRSLLFRKLFVDAKLERYRDNLVSRLKEGGFSVDNRSFRPHLTIARETDLNGVDLKLLPGNGERPVFNANKVDLMKSERINGRLVYTSIYSRSDGNETG